MKINFNQLWKKDLGLIYKEVSIDRGKQFKVDIDLKEVKNIYANYKVNNKYFTDSIEIVDIENNIINVPFRSSVLEKGKHELEIIAVMKNGNVLPSNTFNYTVNESLENEEALGTDTKYPVLISLIDKVSDSINSVEEAISKIPSKEELIGPIGPQGIAGKDGLTASIKVNNQTYTHSNGIITIPNYPSTEGLATKDYVNQEINKIDVTNQLTDYAKKSELPTKISQLTNDSGYLTSIPSEYVTEAELIAKGYLTKHQDLSHLALKTDLHSHSNKSVLDNITSAKVTEWNNKSNLTLGTTSSTAYRGDYGNVAYTHSQSTHAPSNAQKNSDITKAEIEAKLTGEITSHTHSAYSLTSHTHSNYSLTTHNHDTSYATKSDLNSLTLGVHTDGMIYLFKNGQPIGNGVKIPAQEGVVGDVIGNVDKDNNIILSGDLENGTYVFKYENADGTFTKIGELEINEGTISNLLKTLEVHLNKRYSGSSNAIANDGPGMFCIIIPLIGDGSTSHTLRFANLKLSLSASTSNTLYLLDSSQKNIGYVNGSSKIASMTSGLTISDNGKSAQIDFVPTATTKYVALSIALNTTYTSIKASDISDYIITLDEKIV